MITLLYIASRALRMMAHTAGPRPLVICGPSGSGKSTLLKKLFDEFPSTFGFSVSHTTRKPRQGEEHGIHYYFVSREQMQEAIPNNEFVETAEFGGNYYGTSKAAVSEIQQKNKVCILDIEINGVEQIKKTDFNPILIFINPPSVEELERRLRKRGTETEATLKKRLDVAAKEIQYGLKEGNFHKIVNNIDIEVAYKEFRDFIINELQRQAEEGVTIAWN